MPNYHNRITKQLSTFSPRCTGHGSGVRMYVLNSLYHLVKTESCDLASNHGKDFVKCELSQLHITLTYMYCPPSTVLLGIISTITLLKETSNAKTSFIIEGNLMLVV